VGSFIYQVKTVDSGQRVGFRIDNDTTLASGTHIGGRKQPPADDSVEQLIDRDSSQKNRPLRDVIREHRAVVRTARALSARNGQAYTWDNNGNLRSDGSKTYTQANHLTAVSGTGLSWSAAYNGDGWRGFSAEVTLAGSNWTVPGTTQSSRNSRSLSLRSLCA
jgi:hypothetical protein